MKPISTRATVRLVSFTMAAIILLSGAGITGYRLVKRYRETIEYTYQSAINELSDYITDIKNTLTKGVYASTASGYAEVFSRLMVYSECAKSALGRLPVSQQQEDTLQKYLSQVGDYSSYMQSKYLSAGAITESELEQLISLKNYGDSICLSVEELASVYGDGSTSMGKEITLGNNLMEMPSISTLELDGGFREINDGFADYPSLIYDGPFSDHIRQKKPALTKDSEKVTQQQAQENAAYFLNISADSLAYSGIREGNLPVYIFTHKQTYVTVTVNGGYVETVNNSRDIGDTTLSYDEALKTADLFLKSGKVEGMTQSYGLVNGGICTVNFAYKVNGVKCYSDLIKVGVAMDNGEIISYSSTGYIMNHKQRESLTPKLTLKQAMSVLSKNLTVKDESLAVIPTPGEEEVLCYEFLCTGYEGDKLLVYINSSSGMEENIFIILESPSGVLTL